MRSWVLATALLAAIVALLPVFYLHFIGPTLLAFVPIHYSADGPDHFVGREWLWNIVWFPTIAFVVLTFLPQVQDGQSLFWSNYRQRRTRLVVVCGLTLAISAFIRSAKGSKNQLLPAKTLLPEPAPRAR